MAKLTAMRLSINFMMDLKSLAKEVGVPCNNQFKKVVEEYVQEQCEFEIDQSMGSYFENLFEEDTLEILKEQYEDCSE